MGMTATCTRRDRNDRMASRCHGTDCQHADREVELTFQKECSAASTFKSLAGWETMRNFCSVESEVTSARWGEYRDVRGTIIQAEAQGRIQPVRPIDGYFTCSNESIVLRQRQRQRQSRTVCTAPEMGSSLAVSLLIFLKNGLLRLQYYRPFEKKMNIFSWIVHLGIQVATTQFAKTSKIDPTGR